MNAIKNWLLGIEHDVEGILSDFFSTIKKLEAAAIHHLGIADAQDRIIAEAQTVKEAAATEAEKAQKAAEAIKALVS